MNLDTYQALASRTLNPDMSKEQQEHMAMMGMVGELGELTELFKKKIFHGKDLTADRAREEAGDFLWYLTCAATTKGALLSDWAGLPDFTHFDDAARVSLDKTCAEDAAAVRTEICRSPTFFFRLAKVVAGLLSVAEALAILAVLLEPYGGLAWAARDNIRKLEARHNIPAGDLEAVPAQPSVTAPPAAGEPTATTTPGGNE